MKARGWTPWSAFAVAIVLAAPLSTAADFNDNDYHELVLFDWGTSQLDVLIVPPAAPDALSRLDAIEAGVQMWEDGIQALGPSWLTSGMNLDHYTLGTDVVPPAALADPEIVVLSGELNPVLLFGIGAPWDFLVCDTNQQMATPDELDLPLPHVDIEGVPGHGHQHDDSPWAVFIFFCPATMQNVCVVLNTNFALNRNGHHRMYDLNTHEMGHCLGIGHVGDALDFSARNFPSEDIMSYQFTPSQVHCVSNLNVEAISGVFARELGRPSSEWMDYNDFVHMNPADYAQAPCSNPAPPLLGDPGVFN